MAGGGGVWACDGGVEAAGGVADEGADEGAVADGRGVGAAGRDGDAAG
jgi:hypothetical protein